jgi:hypothetical protein
VCPKYNGGVLLRDRRGEDTQRREPCEDRGTVQPPAKEYKSLKRKEASPRTFRKSRTLLTP